MVPARTVWLLQPSPDLRPVAGFVSVRGNRRVEARVFKPRKWQTGFKPGLQLGEPCLPGHPDVPASVSPPAPKRVLPTPVSPRESRKRVHHKGEVGGHPPTCWVCLARSP